MNAFLWSVLKAGLCAKPSYENEFDQEPLGSWFNLHENEPVVGTHFHINGFAFRLVLTQRQKGTRTWCNG